MAQSPTYFFNVEEVILEFMEHCDIASLVKWAHISSKFHRIAQGIIHSRLRNIIEPFIPDTLYLQFFTLLHKTNSLIAGSAALAIMTPKLTWKPFDLNIMIPRGRAIQWQNFFEHHGFQGGIVNNHTNHPRYRHRQKISTRALYIYRSHTKGEVVLIESRDSPFWPIVTSQVMSQMNAISSSHIYCLYPELTVGAQAFQGYQGDPNEDLIFPSPLTAERFSCLWTQGLTLYEDGGDFD
ncbi:uncharacterized protein EV420DRAFT_1645672 [Desarmillaria tabescens]|uniref:Uncharacterized protein n=1 Tax=Armillaria tabescens TaxID=1929756 RepID=A0AA39K1W8_ARMTA|nr:uncharacterized protein EV420DRAFT_1645672 [Desarmillaria tabescens]KAK0452817.1 hypothetical protein EV420DRAFT_1645672 [Desarmillaria tabescens]